MKCCERNYRDREGMLNSDVHKQRIKFLKKFIGKSNNSIDIGCGGFMPSVLNTSHACDIHNSSKFLKSLKWSGEFKVSDISKKLPYKDREFKIAICSEVIEHLKSKKAIFNAFNELDRISNEWIVTTPATYDIDTDHNFHFGYNDDNLFDFIPDIEFIVIRKGYYYYISNSVNKLKKIFGINGK